MTEEQLEGIAKGWYNEQRGRFLGNTRAWDDLAADEKVQILNTVNHTLHLIRSTFAFRSKPQ